MLRNCPDPLDVQDLQFKLRCRLKIFENTELNKFLNWYTLVSAASRYGLMFVGSCTPNFQVIQTKCVVNYSPKEKDITNYPRRNVSLPNVPLHLSVNCDCTVLAVVVEKNNCPTAIFYDVLSFYKRSISIVNEVRLSATPGVCITEVNWNPSLPSLFTACKSNGSLGVYEIKENSVDINELPPASEATCFCWSLKGKRIAVGSKNGKVTQYKPDLKPVAATNEPPLEGQHIPIALQWVANYQFVGVYQPVQGEEPAKVIVIDAPKTGQNVYTNYEDICYSGSGRKAQFYMIFQQQWNILTAASSNSTEVGVLGLTAADSPWIQWILSDAGRAELPLSSSHEESFPIGMAYDTSPTQRYPWGESTIPPCPYLLLLSHQGVLCVFDVVNLKEGAPTICCPPDSVADTSGLALFTTESPGIIEMKRTAESSIDTEVAQPPSVTVTVQSTFSFSATTSTTKPANTSSATAAATTTSMTAPLFSSSQPGLFGNASKPLFGQPPTSSATATVTSPLTFEAKNASGSVAGKPLFSNPASALLGGQITLTPVCKAQAVTTANAAGTDRYSSIFSALQQPNASTPVKPQHEMKTIVITPTSQSMSRATSSTEKQPQPLTTIIRQQTSASDDTIKDETKALLEKMIKEECYTLDTELQELLKQGQSINVNIGTEQEKDKMVENVNELQAFVGEIVEVSLGQNAEVYSLKQDLIYSWVLYEDALSRYNSSKDETCALLFKSQPLDPVAEKRQTDMQKLLYYIDSQLSQASKALDEQWDKFQDYAKKTYRTQMPTMETIFQTMVRQNAVLQKLMYKLKDISHRVKRKSTTLGESHLLLSVENVVDLEDQLKNLEIGNETIQHHYYKKAAERSKHLTQTKSDKLRQLLKNKEVVHVASIQPHLLSMLDSSRSKLKSILGAHVSPISKLSAVKELDFKQSTPMKSDTEAVPVTPVSSEPRKLFFKPSSSEPISTVTTSAPTSGFQPLAKGVTAFGGIQPNLPVNKSSAFVPTTQATKTFSSTASSVSAPVVSSTSSLFSSCGASSFLPKTETTSGSTFITSKPSSTILSFGGAKPTTAESKPAGAVGPTPTFSFASSKINDKSAVTSSVFGSVKLTTAASAPGTSPTFSFASTSKSNIFGTSSASAVSPTTSSEIFSPTTKATSAPVSSSASSGTFNFVAKLTSAPTPLITGSVFSVSSTTTPTFGAVSSTTLVEKAIAATAAEPMRSTQSTISVSKITPSAPLHTSDISTTSSTITSSTTAETITSFLTVKPTVAVSSATTSTTATTPVSSTSAPIFGSASPVITSTQSAFGNTFSSASSIFGSTTASSVKSLFGTSPNVTTATSAAPSTVFGTSTAASTTTTASIFGRPITAPTTGTVVSPQPVSSENGSIFGKPATSTTANLFGNSPSFAASSITTSSTGTAFSGSIFGSPAAGNATTSVFGGGVAAATSTTSAATPSTGASMFGTGTITATTSASSFSAGSIAASAPPVFGTVTSTPSTGGSLFGTPTSTTSTTIKSQSLFGTSSGSSLFGVPATTTGSVFGASTTTASVFGAPTVVATTASAFGFSSPTSTSIFGTPQTSAAVATQGSIFGANTQSSVFGGGGTTQPSSVFAQPQQQTNVFGSTPTSKPAPSIFGSHPSTGISGGSLFGAAPVFGQATTTVPSTTTAGGAFGGGSLFGATPTAQMAPAFGQQPATAAPIFGGGSSTTSGSVFGAPAAATPVFGTTTSSAFGATSPPSSSFSFGQPASNTGSSAFDFGGLSVGGATGNTGGTFGSSAAAQANPFGRADQKSPFSGGGGSGAFGSSTSIFGSGSTGSTFGGSATFGTPSGPFSSGNVGVAQSGFGSPTAFQKPASPTGASPAFGSAPTFGGAPAFGAPPTFGGTPTFGSPGKVFGATATGSPQPAAATGGAFGGSTTGSPGFGNLANQSTIGFGNLAQQAQTPTSAPFSGSSSFSTWR